MNFHAYKHGVGRRDGLTSVRDPRRPRHDLDRTLATEFSTFTHDEYVLLGSLHRQEDRRAFLPDPTKQLVDVLQAQVAIRVDANR